MMFGLILLMCIFQGVWSQHREYDFVEILSILKPEDFLKPHNEIRDKINNGGYPKMPAPAVPLEHYTWDEKLARMAEKWTEKCDEEKHSPRDGILRLKLGGENLAFSHQSEALMKNHTEIARVIGEHIKLGWSDEEEAGSFKYGSWSSGALHFTQVIWQFTKQIGCGVSRCVPKVKKELQDRIAIVCHYSPGGNCIDSSKCIKDSTIPYESAGYKLEVETSEIQTDQSQSKEQDNDNQNQPGSQNEDKEPSDEEKNYETELEGSELEQQGKKVQEEEEPEEELESEEDEYSKNGWTKKSWQEAVNSCQGKYDKYCNDIIKINNSKNRPHFDDESAESEEEELLQQDQPSAEENEHNDQSSSKEEEFQNNQEERQAGDPHNGWTAKSWRETIAACKYKQDPYCKEMTRIDSSNEPYYRNFINSLP